MKVWGEVIYCFPYNFLNSFKILLFNMIVERLGGKLMFDYDMSCNYCIDITDGYTVSPLIMSAPQKCVIPKEKAMLCLFSFGIKKFWGADIIRGYMVVISNDCQCIY